MPATITTLQRQANGHADWKTFLADKKTGDSFAFPMAARNGALSASRYCSHRFQTNDNRDGTFTLTIGEPHDRREAILGDFKRLSTGRLEALHQAATKSGLFTPVTSP